MILDTGRENAKLKERLERIVREKRISHAYLFEGPSDMDKEAFARGFIKGILCPKGLGENCGECSICDKVDHGNHEDISYFPSYELISTHPIRGQFFEPDLRNVNDSGVTYVMSHFFGKHSKAAQAAPAPPKPVPAATPPSDDQSLELVCEEGLLDQFADATPVGNGALASR